jgi:hypothetical protein
MKKFVFLVTSGILSTSMPLVAAPQNPYQIQFGPFIGSGNTSSSGKVRHSSGYGISIDRNYPLSDGLSLGPRLEVANSFVNTRAKSDSLKHTATYDNRFMGLGLTLRQKVGNQHTLAQLAYLSVTTGRGFSKLTIDSSSANMFQQVHFGKIEGNYFGSEMGAWLPLGDDFGINVAFMVQQFRADQTAVGNGSRSGEYLSPEGQQYLLTGSVSKEDSGLDDEILIRTVAGKISLAIGF